MTNHEDVASKAIPEADDASEDDELPERAGTAMNVGAALVPLLLGLAGAVGSIQLGLGDLLDPGAGLWPFVICLALVGCSTALLIGGRRFRNAERFTPRSLRVLAAIAGISLFVAVVPYVGFEFPSILLIFAWVRFFGREPWWLSAVLAVALTTAFWLLFVLVLQIPLPRLF